MKKQILASAAIAIALIAAPSAALAVNYTGSTSSNTVSPGGTITYSAETGQPQGTPALVTANPDVTFSPANSTTYAVGAAGHFAFSFVVPTSTAPGTVITLTVTAGTFNDTHTVTVTAISSGGLAHTGVDVAPYLWFGGGGVALGLALIVVVAVTRRNRKLIDTQA